ncbi:nucleotide disphospho-sugar-binding domain-containing protein [Nesterenkonia ebinurensis]|uniref:nucleotide disphospho-sugar-binding domain-containing protein n=1 Tax=Nesterenkonia ebinurensis TaxID=2608252 RepID=UPI00123D01A3|nr:glycosyltransferase [Nesterenkonia ebinurensis]
MATYLLCSNPIHGHVGPLQEVGADLRRRGHRVILLTGSRFEQGIRSRKLEFRPLGPGADYDDRDVDSYLPDQGDKRGLARAQYDIQTIFVRPIPAQARAVAEIVECDSPDAIMVDGMFAGVVPLLLGPREDRPPILALGVSPLAQASRDVAPAGMGLAPASSILGRLRNRALNVVAQRILFAQTQRLARQVVAQASPPGTPPLREPIMDFSRLLDRFLQLSPSEFEYPRSDLAANTVFIGALPPTVSDAPEPSWWHELDGTRPVVHVTQGTIDNRDFDRLVRPTIAGLQDSGALVVVTTGGRDPAELGEVPANVRVARFLPYNQLLPLLDVFVTNGGFGGVQQALGAGVPVVAAGDTEDKPEVTARVGWAGVGIDLRTGTPSAPAVADAVRAVLRDESYRIAARELAAQMAKYDPYDAIDRELAEVTQAR